VGWRPRPRYETRILLLTLLSGLPGSGVALLYLWFGDHEAKVQWTLTLFIVALWLGFAAAVRRRVVFPLQTLANLLQASREGDFSLRARRSVREDVLSEVMREVNILSETLMEQRLGAVEATALLQRVVEAIEVAIFTFDGGGRLRLVNPAGERLLAQPAERLLGSSAAQLGLAEFLAGEAGRTVQRTFPGGEGRWGVRRSGFREGGLHHDLLVIANLSRALREEERQAWKRLIRVLGHELNNSLAPIKSMAATLVGLLRRRPLAADWQEDMERGLSVIAQRSESLSRFMAAYSRLARLPPPKEAPVAVGPLLRRVAALESRLAVALEPGPELTIRADGDQLEQLLINLVRNAVDAAGETGGRVSIGWTRQGPELEVKVEDEGPGLPDTGNLFVPFFTTKPSGTGIGLVLSRQIAEAHGGSLTLRNRRPGPGCEARLRLPL
jgi:nitrogen fixation/metabolism regulation signal transduction histidine kinase